MRYEIIVTKRIRPGKARYNKPPKPLYPTTPTANYEVALGHHQGEERQ